MLRLEIGTYFRSRPRKSRFNCTPNHLHGYLNAQYSPLENSRGMKLAAKYNTRFFISRIHYPCAWFNSSSL